LSIESASWLEEKLCDKIPDFYLPLEEVIRENPTFGINFVVVEWLDGKTFTREVAMQLLDDVSQPDWTRWSAVYDLDNFAVDVE